MIEGLDDGASRFSMYTDVANQRVQLEVALLVAKIEADEMRRNDLPEAVRAMCKEIAKDFGEVYDTEPQWAISDALSDACQKQGWLPISRWDW